MRAAPALLPAFLVDAAVVGLFASIGRQTHSGGVAVLGVLTVAAPFLVGLACAWVVTVRVLHRRPDRMSGAMPVWVLTVAVGLLLRVLDRGQLPLSFAVVTALTLGVFLLGWRAAWALLRSRRRAGQLL